MNQEALETVLRQCGLIDEYARQEAVFLWPQTVGQLASFAQASFVQDGILHVVAANASVAQELRLLAPALLEKLNARLHTSPLHTLRVETGEVPRIRRSNDTSESVSLSAEEKALFDDVQDPELRARFLAVYQRQRQREADAQRDGSRRCPACGVVFSGPGDVCPGCRYEAIEVRSQAD